MTSKPLLSIVTVNRNDNYHKNLVQRTKFILNYFIYSLKKMNAFNKVEYIIVDWGSQEPFSNFFYKELSSCPSIKFINVPKEETVKNEIDFDTSKAINLGINNCSGEHVMLGGADQFFPISVFNNLINVLEKPEMYGIKGDEYKIVPRKFLDDDFFIYESNMEKVDIYFQRLKQSMNTFKSYPMNCGGGAGGNLIKKKDLLKIGGIKDTKPYNDGQDIILINDISNFTTHIDTATFGCYLLKLPRSKYGDRKKERDISANTQHLWEFGKYENLMNLDNIEIIDFSNPPKKKLFLDSKVPSTYKEPISCGEVIKTISDCTFFLNYFKFSLDSSDIEFILNIKRAVKTNHIKHIIFDEKQAKRFIFYFAKNFPDNTFLILLDPKKYNSLDTVKFRTIITASLKSSRHYGHIEVTNSEKSIYKIIDKSTRLCVIQDLCSQEQDQMNFIHEIDLNLINAIRLLGKYANDKGYKIINKFTLKDNYEQKIKFNKISNFFIFFLIFLIKFKKKLSKLKISMFLIVKSFRN
jgi:hypothetical protein